MKKKSDCQNFVGLPTNPDVCAKWVRPGQRGRILEYPEPGFGGNPISIVSPGFCQVEEKCESLGLRLVPRADQEEDSFE